MGVKAAEADLIKAAEEWRATGNVVPLLAAAEAYARSKKNARDARDRWKEKKRLGHVEKK